STDEFLCRSVICKVLSIDLVETGRDGDESIKITIELEHPSQVLEMRANPIDLALSICDKIIVEPDDLSGRTGVSNYPSPVRRISAEVHGRIEPCMAEYPTPFPIPDCRTAVAFRQFLDRRSVQLMHTAEQGQLQNAGVTDHLPYMPGNHFSVFLAVPRTGAEENCCDIVLFPVKPVQKIERRRRDAVGDHSTEVDHDLLSPVTEVSLHVISRLVLAKDDIEDACSSLPIVVGRQLSRHSAVSLIFVGEFGFEKFNICQVGNV